MSIFIICSILGLINSVPIPQKTLESLEYGQRQILSQIGHVAVWKFPEGPMTLGGLLVAVGLSLGVCLMCCYMHCQWREMTQGAADAVQSMVQRHSRDNEVFANASTNMVLAAVDTSSMVVHEATFDDPPSYEEAV